MPRESTGRLFDEPEDEQSPAMETQDGSAAAPLAERMRPRTLEEFVGQAGLVGSESLLARALRPEGKLPSLILWGPPGTGKTTLARLIARATEARLIALSAVLSGVKEVRACNRRGRQGPPPWRPGHPLHRRDPPLQQGPARCAPARRRAGNDHAHRRHDREPLVRGQRGLALPLPRGRPATSCTGRDRAHPESCTGRRVARPGRPETRCPTGARRQAGRLVRGGRPRGLDHA